MKIIGLHKGHIDLDLKLAARARLPITLGLLLYSFGRIGPLHKISLHGFTNKIITRDNA